MIDELNRKPRRRVVMVAKLEADSWDDLHGALNSLSTEIAMHGRLSASSVSGGYSGGHIIVTSEDGDITHDSWAVELNRYLESMAEAEAKQQA